MDLSKKLEFYSKNQTAEAELSPSLKALKEHFGGQILYDDAPVLEIFRTYDAQDYTNRQISLNLLTRSEFKESIERTHCVFFDLETTGLAGGAGTFAFLIGFAYWVDEQIHTRQFFLPDFGREYRLFNEINEWLNQFEYLVSYNGKTFDLPLLTNRYVLNRVDNDFRQKNHIDLVHLCRRIWKDSIESCSLISIEENLLGMKREGDIPGSMVPQAYFDFLYTGVVHDVIRMIEHNWLDIVSSAKIFDQLHFVDKKPGLLNLDEPALGRLAKLAYENNHYKYFDFLETHIEKVPDEFKYWKSLALKRQSKAEEAFTIWTELVKNKKYWLPLTEEMLKHLEFSKKDYKKCLELINSTMSNLRVLAEIDPYSEYYDWLAKFQKRRLRIENKKVLRSEENL